MIKYFFAAIFFLSAIKVCGQSFYVASSTNYGTNTYIKKLTINGSSVTEQNISSCTYSSGIPTIAIDQNKFYYCVYSSLLSSTISGNSIINCAFKSSMPYNSALTADKNGILYAANLYSIYKIDPNTGVSTLLGNMPYSSAGDLVFYKNELYMGAGQGIVKVNLIDPSKSTLVIPGIYNVFGLASVAYSATQTKVYALSQSSSNNYTTTDVYELDLDNNQLGAKITTLPYVVFDAASAVPNNISINQYADCPFTGNGTVQVVLDYVVTNYQYTLNGVTNSTGIFTNVAPGTYQIAVNSGTSINNIAVTVPDYNATKPVVTYTATNPVCDTSGTIKLSMQEADTSLYQTRLGKDIFNFNHLFTGLTPGSYHFDVLNKQGCAVTSVDVTLSRSKCKIALDSITVQQECNLINKGSIQVNSKPNTYNYPYTYALNSVTNTTGLFYGLSAGNYIITITSSEDQKKITVTVPDYKINAPVVIFTTIKATCDLKGDIKFSVADNSQQYKIKFNDIIYPVNYNFNNLDAGSYDFTVIKPNGCLLDIYRVNVESTCKTPVSPNAFTPNADGINDIFRPVTYSNAVNFKLHVYNRYGTVIFNSESPDIGWNGQYKGNESPPGVYYWVASYVNNVGKLLTKSGYVTLIR